jgi:hypothetical protein
MSGNAAKEITDLLQGSHPSGLSILLMGVNRFSSFSVGSAGK